MTFAYWCIFAAMLMPLGCAFYAKKSAGFVFTRDNGNPRAFLEKAEGAAARADAARDQDGQMDRSGWTAVERDVLDSLRWWPLDELDAAVGAGMIVYPGSLPALARALLRGWDGTLLTIREED